MDIFEAVKKGDLKAVKGYLTKDSKALNAKDEYGRTSLHLASREGYFDIVKYLIERGADVNIDDDINCTPLHLASRWGRLDCAKYLVEHGADVNIMGGIEKNLTPLHSASVGGHLDIVQYLIEQGADINRGGVERIMPLHFASSIGHLGVVKYLIERGADVGIKDKDGKTAYDRAENDEVRSILEDAEEIRAEFLAKNVAQEENAFEIDGKSRADIRAEIKKYKDEVCALSEKLTQTTEPRHKLAETLNGLRQEYGHEAKSVAAKNKVVQEMRKKVGR